MEFFRAAIACAFWLLRCFHGVRNREAHGVACPHPAGCGWRLNRSASLVPFLYSPFAGKPQRLAPIILLLSSMLGQGQALAVSYTVTVLPLACRGINNAGQLACTGNNGHAVLYQNGTMIDLGTLGGTTSTATAINNAGQVVGYSYTAGNAATHAFLYQNGTMTDLGTLGGTFSFASDINDAGQVVGGAELAEDADGNIAQHAFLYQNGIMTDLGSLATWAFTEDWASGINDAGQVAGTYGYTMRSCTTTGS